MPGPKKLNHLFRLLDEEFGFAIKTQLSDLINNGDAGGTLVSITVPDSVTRHVVQES